jgi:DNA polymerase-3 subunit beta
MKITIPRTNLVQALSRVIDCVQTKITMPVLGSVLLEAGSALSLYTTNLDVSANTSTAATIEKQGAIALPAKQLLAIVSGMPDGDVSISCTKEHRATIKCGAAVFQISGLPKDEFPAIPALVDANKIEMAATWLYNMLHMVSYAATTDATRFILMGVNMAVKDGNLCLQATDGRRIARVIKAIESAPDLTIIIPSHTVAVVSKLLKDAITVSMGVAARAITFRLTCEGGEIIIHSKVVEGTYPNTQQVVPKDKRNIMSVAREPLLEIAKRVALVCDDKVNYLKLSASKNKLIIKAASPSMGEAEEEMVVAYDGPELTIGVNHTYFCDPIAMLGGDKVAIDLRAEVEPIVFYGDEPGFVGVVMPCKIA